MSADLHLYSAQACPFAQRTRLVLITKGLDFETTEIDLKHTPDWFLRLSPYGKVPLLISGEDRIWESAIINEYLEDRFPRPPSLPRSPGGRALARIWIDFANTRFVPLFYKLLLEQTAEGRARLAERLIEALRFVENEALAPPGRAAPYWLGATPTLVDLTFYPFFERLCVLEHYRGFAIPADCERLAQWLAAVRELPAVRETAHPDEYHIRNYVRYADGTASGSTAQEMRETA